MAVSPSPSSGLSVEIRLKDQKKTGLDVKLMRKELHRMKMELIGALDNCGIERTQNEDLLQRDGSVRGRSLHVMSTVRHLANRSQWKRDYVAEESGKVVLYITSCQVINANYERCRDSLSLLRALSISHEVRDVYLEPKLMEELIDRMQLEPDLNRDLIFESLPMVFVNGRYFGNDATLTLENEARSLFGILHDFHPQALLDLRNVYSATSYSLLYLSAMPLPLPSIIHHSSQGRSDNAFIYFSTHNHK